MSFFNSDEYLKQVKLGDLRRKIGSRIPSSYMFCNPKDELSLFEGCEESIKTWQDYKDRNFVIDTVRFAPEIPYIHKLYAKIDKRVVYSVTFCLEGDLNDSDTWVHSISLYDTGSRSHCDTFYLQILLQKHIFDKE